MTNLTVYAMADTIPNANSREATIGPPVIRCVNCGDYVMALEGSHRLAAAHATGITPHFVIHDQDDEIDITDFDWFNRIQWADTFYPAGEVAGELYSPQAVPYRFELP